MTRGDFDETAARAALDWARSRWAAASAAAREALDARIEARDALVAAEREYALVVAFDGRPPRVGDTMRAGVADGYPEGRVVDVRVVQPDGRTARASSVHVTVETARGTYVARRLVEPRKAQP